MADERTKSLMGLDEFEASTLSREDWYDRGRLIRQKIGMDMVAKYNKGYSESTNTKQQDKNSNTRPYGRDLRLIKD